VDPDRCTCRGHGRAGEVWVANERSHYPGPHAIELKINGTPSNTATFELVDTALSL
jgi:hypothetical protein